MFSSSRLRDAGVAACAAVALAAAFPKLGAAWLVPFATAGLFWVWQGASWKWAALLGWFAGIVFFAIGFSWIGHTVGGYIGVFGPFLMFGPALLEAPFFALAGMLAAVAYRRMAPGLAPLGAAAAFTVASGCRSIGVLGAPFDQLGYTQAGTPLRAIAAYAGTYGITFVLCVAGAYLADSIRRARSAPVCGRSGGRNVAGLDRVDGMARAAARAAFDRSRGHSGQHRTVVEMERAEFSDMALFGDDARGGAAEAEACRVAGDRHYDDARSRSRFDAAVHRPLRADPRDDRSRKS